MKHPRLSHALSDELSRPMSTSRQPIGLMRVGRQRHCATRPRCCHRRSTRPDDVRSRAPPSIRLGEEPVLSAQ